MTVLQRLQTVVVPLLLSNAIQIVQLDIEAVSTGTETVSTCASRVLALKLDQQTLLSCSIQCQVLARELKQYSTVQYRLFSIQTLLNYSTALYNVGAGS